MPLIGGECPTRACGMLPTCPLSLPLPSHAICGVVCGHAAGTGPGHGSLRRLQAQRAVLCVVPAIATRQAAAELTPFRGCLWAATPKLGQQESTISAPVALETESTRKGECRRHVQTGARQCIAMGHNSKWGATSQGLQPARPRGD